MRWGTVACALQATSVCGASLAGEVTYRCFDSGTQVELNGWAHQMFLDASAEMSRRLRDIESALKPSQQPAWQRVQKSWLTFKTQACQFESSAVAKGSTRPMVERQCGARMTNESAAEPARLAACPEGDIACPMRRFAKPHLFRGSEAARGLQRRKTAEGVCRSLRSGHQSRTGFLTCGPT